MTREYNEEITLKEYLYVILNRKRIILIGIFLTVFIVALYTFTRKPIYESYSTVRIDQERGNAVLFGNFNKIINQEAMQTEIEMIKSRTLSEGVVRNLNLNLNIIRKSPDLNIKLDNIVLSDNFYEGTITFVFTSNKDYNAFINDKKVFSGKLGKVFDFENIHFIPNGKNATKGKSFILKIGNIKQKALALSNSIKVTPVKDAQMVKITSSSNDPVMSAKIANYIAHEYIIQSIEYERSDARNVRVFIDKRLLIALQSLKEAEDALRLYKEKENFVILDENAKDYINKLSNFETQKAQIEMDIKAQEMTIENVNKQMSDTLSPYNRYKELASIPSLSGNTTIRELQSRMMELELKKSELLQEFTEKHPEVIAINGQIEDITKSMNSIVKNVLIIGPASNDPIYQNMMSTVISSITIIKADSGKIQALNRVINKYNKKLKNLPRKEVTLAQLVRKKNVNEQIYTMLLTKLEEAKINEARAIAPVRIVDSAIVPTSPVKPRKKLNLIMGLFLGILVGVGGAFLLEYMDNTIKSPEIIEEHFGMPFIGIIPTINGSTKQQVNNHFAIRNKLITQYEPQSPIAEAYRVIRTNLQFASLDNPIKSILLTGVQPGDGKTTTVCNLAITYANMGLKTVVVDTDLRKAQIHKMFGIKENGGISNYLIEDTKLESITYKTEIENLSVIPAGKIKGNFGEILNSNKMKNLIKSLNDKYDIVLYDSPPILSVADPLILGSLMDGIILVVRYGFTDKDGLMHVKKTLSQHSTKLIGTILNDTHKEYYSYGYRYYYNDYYGESKKKGKNKFLKFLGRI
jgi:capsular exopolysaccharide synthesis family protein